MTEVHHATVELGRDPQHQAKRNAKKLGHATLPPYFLSLIEEYAAGPKPANQRRARRNEYRLSTKVAVPEAVWRAAKERAFAEGKGGLSEVVEELVARDARLTAETASE